MKTAPASFNPSHVVVSHPQCPGPCLSRSVLGGTIAPLASNQVLPYGPGVSKAPPEAFGVLATLAEAKAEVPGVADAPSRWTVMPVISTSS
jgi:hypothetical protein